MWPAVILNMLLPILGIIIVSNIGSAFGVHVFPDMMIIAAVGASVMALPMVSSTLCFLVVLAVEDMNMSGPPGLAAFVGVIIYLILRLITVRNPPQRFIGMVITAFIATILYHGLLAFVYSLYYPEVSFGYLFIMHGWKYAIATAIFAQPVIWLAYTLAGLFEKRQKRGII